MKLNVNDFEILDSYNRRGKSVTLKAKLFENDDEEVNNYGWISIQLNESNIFESLQSFEYGDIILSDNDIQKLESKIVQSIAYKKAMKSYSKK